MVSNQPRPSLEDLRALENCNDLCKKLINKGKDLPGFDLRTMRQMSSDIEKILRPRGSCAIRISPNSAEEGSKNVFIQIIAHAPSQMVYHGVTVRLIDGSGSLKSRTGGPVLLQESRTENNGQVLLIADVFLNGSNAKPGKASISLFLGEKPCATATFQWKKAEAPKIKDFSCVKDRKEHFAGLESRRG